MSFRNDVTSRSVVAFQSFLDEIRLLQHALHKYKLELRALEMQSRSLYGSHHDELQAEERLVIANIPVKLKVFQAELIIYVFFFRDALDSLDSLRKEIGVELENAEQALTSRKQQVLSGDDAHLQGLPPLDLGSLQVVSQVHRQTLRLSVHMIVVFQLLCHPFHSQMIEMLKEQVYHSTIVTSLSTDTSRRQVSSQALLTDLDKYSHHDETANSLELLQQQMTSQQAQSAAALSESLKEVTTR